jgi:hypothetical protein
MKNTRITAEEAREAFNQLQEAFNGLKHLIQCSLDSEHERNDFKYNCLSKCEPGLFNEHNWMTQYDGITSMEGWVERMEEDAAAEEADEDDEEGKEEEGEQKE